MHNKINETSIVSIDPIESIYTNILHQINTTHCPEYLYIDCRSIGFIRVDGILAILNIARLWHRQTGNPVVLCSMQSQVYQYFERMDVFLHCQEFIKADGISPTNSRYERQLESNRLLELTPIASDQQQNTTDVSRSLDRAGRILRDSLRCDASLIRQLLTILSEVTNNITHSADQGYAIIQRHNRCIVISVTDLGIGIEASLQKNGSQIPIEARASLRSGSDFLRYALILGSTSRRSPGGMGLHQIRGIVNELRGSLTIRSFSSLIRVDAKNQEDFTSRDNLAVMPGTQVTISIRE